MGKKYLIFNHKCSVASKTFSGIHLVIVSSYKQEENASILKKQNFKQFT